MSMISCGKRGCYTPRMRAATLLVLGLFFAYLFAEKTLWLKASVALTEEAWRERIATVGASAAAEEFLGAAEGLEPDDVHARGHEFGAALYRANEPLTVCMNDLYLFGCVHEYLGLTIIEGGLSAVKNIVPVCASMEAVAARRCEHGIGHGLAAYFGYTTDDLVEALAWCDEAVRSPDCLSGVLMEYRFHTMLDGAGAALVGSDVYEPCLALPTQFRAACVLELPQWWRHKGNLGTDITNEQLVHELVSYCKNLPTDSLRQVCVRGVGKVTYFVQGGSPAISQGACAAVGLSRQDRLMCLYGAAHTYGFLSPESRTQRGLDVCSGLQGNELIICERYAQQELHILEDTGT